MNILNSIKIEALLENINLRDSELKLMFQECLKEIWNKALFLQSDGRVFVSSADKKIMSLRESTALMLPLCLLSHEDAALKVILRGVIDSQMQFILTDPYANTFIGNTADISSGLVSPEIYQRHFSIDSILAPVQLIWSYWQSTDDNSIFDDTVLDAFRLIYQTLYIEQNHIELSEYKLEIGDDEAGELIQKSMHRPVGQTGMIWSAFRPSGHPCMLNYHIPSQMLAVMILNYMITIFRDIYSEQDTAEDIMVLQEKINVGIRDYGIIEHPEFGDIYLYETDGLEDSIMMDEANFPNLLSIPYFGYDSFEDKIYQNTRKFIFSQYNPNYINGKTISGLGESDKGVSVIYPISLIMQALTTENHIELGDIIEKIKKSHLGTYQMQDKVHPDDLRKIKSSKSAIANALLLELILTKLIGIY